MKGYLREIYRKLYLTIRFFTEKRVMTQASALSYSTLLAIVPILAVVFAIARGFGYNKYIELWFRESLSTQPQVADIIVGFVNSYLVHTQSGIFLGVGLVFMLYSVLMLISNIEDTFNQIWQLSSTRPIIRSITNYLDGFRILGPAIRRMLSLAPCVLMSLMFIILYVYMPNTKVRFSSAIVPGILAGIAMQVLQLAYIHSQIWVTGYNAIYGSFAALPLFMLWIQISWTICLFGAQLTFTNENMNRIGFNLESLNVHPKVEMTDEERGNTEIFADNIDDL